MCYLYTRVRILSPLDRTRIFKRVKRLIIHFLVFTLLAGGVLASPAVMAWSMMSASGSASDCTLCQADSADQQNAGTMMTTCVVSACASMAAINPSMLALV